MIFTEAVRDRARIERQLDRLAARAEGRRLDTLVQDGVRFADILDERAEVVRLVARALGDASYRPSIARVGHALLGGKPREIARVGALDLIAHAVVGDVLADAIEPSLSAHLWSYRPGRSSWQALRAVARFARAHVRAHQDPRDRGLFVLRADVRSYTDEIPVHEGAPLWSELARALRLDDAQTEMVRALVRPEVEKDGATARRDRGVLFGLPTTTAIANLYLMPLDAALEALGGMYARFGDDVLFASDRHESVLRAKHVLEDVLVERGLALNAKKLRVLFWNGAARTSDAHPDVTATVTVPFLGGAVRFDGTIALPAAKWRALLVELRTRIRSTAKLASELSPKDLAKVLATIVNDAFDLRSDLAVPQAQLVSDLVSDRTQLRELDHLVALWIAEAVTKVHGPRAFRKLPPRTLRNDAGLASRVVARNRYRQAT